MSRDFYSETVLEERRKQLIKEWYRKRVSAIHSRLSAHDVLRRNGVDVKYPNREEQISCPFHGADNRPSARFYPATDTSHSHVWCYVCRESWDAISLWKKFAGFEGTFGSLLSDIERTCGLNVPDLPIMAEEPKTRGTQQLQQIFSVVENRLKDSCNFFDKRGYLTICVLLDRLYAAADDGMEEADVQKCLRKILDKIGEKCRG